MTRVDATIPLLNNRTDITLPVKVSNSFKPVRFSDTDRAQLATRLAGSAPQAGLALATAYEDLKDISLQLAGSFAADSVTTTMGDMGEWMRGAESAVTGLRLVHSGQVGADAMYLWAPPGSVFGMMTYALADLSLPPREPINGRQNYTLPDADLTKLRSLVRQLLRLDVRERHSALWTAIRRFNTSYGRGVDEDRLVDQVIALESCLLSGAAPGIQYRFCMRGSALLCQSRDPVRTYYLLETLYEARSRIVHEGASIRGLDSDRNLRRLLQRAELGSAEVIPDTCEEVVRDSLVSYLQRALGPAGTSGSSDTEVKTSLDQALLAGLVRGPRSTRR